MLKASGRRNWEGSMEMGLGLLQVGSPGRFPGPLEKSLLEAAGLGHVYAGEREMSRSGLWVFF